MRAWLKEIGIPVVYFPITREYALEMVSSKYPVGLNEEIVKYSILFYRFYFCPGCGEKLRESLRNTYIETLKKEFNINLPITYEKEKIIPEEFRSNKWWKKRNL